MTVQPTNISECFLITPQVFNDERGSFSETFNKTAFTKATGIEIDFVQDNQSIPKKGVLRGLHFQKEPYAQSKLVRVIKGEIQDVCLDLRKDSPTFGAVFTTILNDIERKQLFIPKGCAHGFLTISNEAIVAYKCDAFYNKKAESGVVFNDKTLNINWKIKNNLIISTKDEQLPSYHEIIARL